MDIRPNGYYIDQMGLDQMGLDQMSLDQMGLGQMRLDQMAINRIGWGQPYIPEHQCSEIPVFRFFLFLYEHRGVGFSNFRTVAGS